MALQPRHRFTGKDDRQVAELIGMARGLTADGLLTDSEISVLDSWLSTTQGLLRNPLAAGIVRQLTEALSDGVIDEEERAALFTALKEFSGTKEFGLGEMPTPTTLPLCVPAPTINFAGRHFTFTGAFVYGSRKECHTAITERGGLCDNSIRLDTSFVVIGQYAAEDWVQSSFGRKIEKAVQYRDERGLPLHIISEAHWQESL